MPPWQRVVPWITEQLIDVRVTRRQHGCKAGLDRRVVGRDGSARTVRDIHIGVVRPDGHDHAGRRRCRHKVAIQVGVVVRIVVRLTDEPLTAVERVMIIFIIVGHAGHHKALQETVDGGVVARARNPVPRDVLQRGVPPGERPRPLCRTWPHGPTDHDKGCNDGRHGCTARDASHRMRSAHRPGRRSTRPACGNAALIA